ncbi:MAG: hypothetical protein GTN60_04825 [Pseudomonas stutzeri]|uniref:hypothetical protein n=1 Tax=Stutzerimonas stutzeri TaxID=316 RepID=UPI0016B0253A|nr:hypothetical protein [Stutzerimonas stutzeri]MDH0084854.1 hypothetical protein [Stutzerimonas stutzeri]NIM30633.1 hypothetical protein [Stutzerimonas stutzeri]NIM53840.1 hypothetical protein [Stutzerimonas stutzeri]NIM86146.1 hypothetical protein [Stutzerimonas stutzeri]NIN80742.1 hypothetical protein [Stutzerimonas stutzeri]
MDTVVYVIPTDANGLAAWATLLSALAAAISAGIAGFALIFTKRQVDMHEKHNRLMATPHLSGWNHQDGETETYSFTLENTGIGPAIIKAITLTVDGHPAQGEGSDMIEDAAERLFPNVAKHHRFEMFTVGEFVPPNKKFEVYSIQAEGLSAEQLIKRAQTATKLVIHYESIYGDKYLYDSDTD